MKNQRRACRHEKCGKAIVYQPTKFRWVHVTKGVDHAPVP